MDSLLSYFINLLISSLESDYNVPLSSISDQINKATRGLDVTVAAFQLVLFLAICFFGYKILKILITIDGALTGLIIGVVAGVFLVNATGLESWVILADSFAFMLLFGFLAFKLYRLGVFLHYFLCGTLVFGVILALFQVEDIWVIIGVSAGFGIIIGILALIFNKIYIIISSALIGGLCAGDAIGVLVETDKDGVKILIGLIIAIAGAVFQFWYENKRTNNVIATDITNENYISSIKDKMGAKVFCAKCGAQSSVENRFCPVCGNDMYSSNLTYHSQNEEIAVPTNIVFTGNEDKGTLKIRMNDALEDGRWGEALLFAERIITTDAEDGEGYLGGLLAECRISNIDSIVLKGDALTKSKYYKGFTKYAAPDLIEKVKENLDKADDIQEKKTIEILNTLIDGIKVFKNKQKEEEIIETSLKNKKGTSKGVLNIIGILCSILFWIMVIFRFLEIILPYEFTVKNTYVYGGTEYRNLILSDFNFARQFFDPNVWLDNVWYKSNMPNIVWTLLYYGVLIFLGNMFFFQVKRRKGQKREISKNRQSYKSVMEEEQQILGAMVPFLACIPITLRDDAEIATVLEDYKNTIFNTENNKKIGINEIIENYSGDINKIDKKISVIPYEGINDLNLKYDYLSELQKVIESMGANLLTSNFEETNGMTSIGNSMQRCSACGTAVEAGACFCNKCGAKIV